MEDWCSDFLAAYNRAKQLNLPEVHGFRAHKDLLSTVLADFLRYHRTTHSTKANIHGGVFATLNGQESPYKKRSRDYSKPSKLCLCGENHFWGQCAYIDTALRTRV